MSLSQWTRVATAHMTSRSLKTSTSLSTMTASFRLGISTKACMPALLGSFSNSFLIEI